MSSFISGWRVSALLAASVAASSLFGAGKELWTAKLPGDAKWHSLTGLGTLIVGTNDAIVAYDPDDGKQLWLRNEFKKSSPFNAREIAGTPFLICHKAEGFAGLTKTTIYQIDYLTGTTTWQTPQVNGQFLGAFPIAEKNLILMLVNGGDAQNKDWGTWVYALDLAEGTQKWATKLAKAGAIQLHVADNTGKFMPTTDLSGYHDPVADGDTVYLPYLGCTAMDLNTGAVKWTAEFKAGNPGLKKTYAPLRIHGDRIYGAGGGSVLALDKNTGATIWKSDRISSYAGLLKARNNALVSQIEIVGDKVFARYGGNFSNGQQVMLMEPLGVVALDPATGDSVYHFDKAKEGITNLLVLPESKLVVFADASEVYGIDVSGATPVESFSEKIEFKRKMGGGDIAKIGLGLTGGLMGVGKAVISSNKARLDVPVAILQQQGHIVVQGKQHLLGFDPQAKSQKWSLFYAAPSDAFATLAMFAVTAASSALGNAQVAQHGSILTSGGQQGMNTIQTGLDRYNRYTEKRAALMAQSKSTAAYSYILTKIGKSGIGLYGVNLATGETDRELVLGANDTDYRVDESTGRIFYFKGKGSIVAYTM